MSTVLPEIATPHNAPRNTTLRSAGSISAWLPHVTAICDPESKKNATRIFRYDSKRRLEVYVLYHTETGGRGEMSIMARTIHAREITGLVI